MKQCEFEIISNESIAKNVYKMKLAGDTTPISACGQFVNIKLDGMFLRRPISVCDAESGVLTIIYKVVGKGTELMAQMSGGKLDLLVGLGNGYDTTLSGEKPLLIGGGVGVPPLYMLAKTLIREGKCPTAVLGFNTADEVFCEEDFSALGVKTIIATADGSKGKKSFVTGLIDEVDYSYFYTCGPEPMLKAVFAATNKSGQFSFEERMGCGFGACMGCSCKTVTGYKRICKDGPVLKKEEILW